MSVCLSVCLCTKSNWGLGNIVIKLVTCTSNEWNPVYVFVEWWRLIIQKYINCLLLIVVLLLYHNARGVQKTKFVKRLKAAFRKWHRKWMMLNFDIGILMLKVDLWAKYCREIKFAYAFSQYYCWYICIYTYWYWPHIDTCVY